MRKYEKEHDIEPDWNVHAFQKAQAIQGQQSSVATEYVIRMLGLDICADTICGNHMMRGISGGQKKRVTSGTIPNSHNCSLQRRDLLFAGCIACATIYFQDIRSRGFWLAAVVQRLADCTV